MQNILKLEDLLEYGTDSISGRKYGQGYAKEQKILKRMEAGQTFKIIIGPKIETINDSFWKGFFNSIYETYKTKEKVKTYFEFEGTEYFLNEIDKNLDVLDAIYNS
jgi:hypothetical protein